MAGGYPCCCPKAVDCDHCDGTPPSQLSVAVSGLTDVACDACSDFDGTYVCDYYQTGASISVCTGGGGSSTVNLTNACEWRTGCLVIRSATGGCAAVSAQMRVYIGENGGTYYLSAILWIWTNDTCSSVTTGWVQFSKSYGSAPTCSSWSLEALGSLDKCVNGSICSYDGSTTFAISA